MAAIDHEAVLLGLKDHFLSKRSHGQDELLQVLTKLEVECRTPEGQESFDSRPIPRRFDEAHDPLLQLEEPRRAALA